MQGQEKKFSNVNVVVHTQILCLHAKRAENLKTDIAGYNLTVEYIQELLDNQNYKCYYTNVDLKIGSKLTNPTLDRIYSNKGYIKGNVCTEIANIMKKRFNYR